MAKARLEATIGLITGPLRRGMARVTRMFRSLRRRLHALGRRMRAFGHRMRQAFLIGAAGIAVAVKQADSFRRAMALVNTMLTAGGNIKQLTADVRALSAELGVAKDALAKGLYQVLSAQIPPENAISFLREATKAAIGGATETEQSVKAIVKVMESWNLTADDAAAISDKLFRITEKGLITYDQLSEKIGAVSGLAAKAGVSINELGGIIATAKTVEPERLFFGLRAALTALLKPGPELREELRKLNMTGTELIAKRGLLGAFEALNEMAGGNADTFAKLVGHARALPIVLAVTGEHAAKAAANIEAMRDSAGASERAFQKMDAARHWPRLWQSILNIVERFGAVLNTAVQPAVEALSKALQNIADSPKFAAFLERVGAATKGIIGAVGSVLAGGDQRSQVLSGLSDVIIGSFQEAAAKMVDVFLKKAEAIGNKMWEGFKKRLPNIQKGFAAISPKTGGILKSAEGIVKVFRGTQKVGEKAGKASVPGAGQARIDRGMEKLKEAAEIFDKGVKEFVGKAKKPEFRRLPGTALGPDIGELKKAVPPPPGGMGEERRFSALRRVGANIIAGAQPREQRLQERQIRILEKMLDEQIQQTKAIIAQDKEAGLF